MPFKTVEDAESFLDQGRKRKFKDLSEASAFLDAAPPRPTEPPRTAANARAGFKSAQEASDFLDADDGMDEGQAAATGRKAIDFIKSLVTFKRPAAAAALAPSPGVGPTPMDPTDARGSLPTELPPPPPTPATPAGGPRASATAPAGAQAGPSGPEPGSVGDFYARGLEAFQNNRPDLAIPIWEEGQQKFPKDLWLRRGVERLRHTMPKGLEVKPESMEKYVEGLAAYKKGDYDTMNEAFRQAEELDPKNPWIRKSKEHLAPLEDRRDLEQPEPTPIRDFLAKLAPGVVEATKRALPVPGAPRSAKELVEAAARPVLAASTPIRSEEGKRMAGAAGSGVTGAAGSMASAVPAVEAFMGMDTRFGRKAEAVGRYLKKLSGEVMPQDPNFAEHLASGAGSMALFMAPAGAVAKGLSLIPATARIAVSLAPAIQTGVSTVLESATEAGGVYQDLIDKGVSRQRAGEAAFKDFWTNAIVIGLTNRLGVFSDKMQGLKKALASAPLEGIQEGAQDILSELSRAQAEDRAPKIDWEQVAQSAGVGAVIGGGAGALPGAAAGAPQSNLTQVLGETGAAHVSKNFPALASAVMDVELPLAPEKASEIMANAVQAGQEVLLAGGSRTDADAAAVKTFTLTAAKELETAKPPAPEGGEAALRAAVEGGGGQWVGVQPVTQPGKENLVLFNDPDTHTTLALPMSQATAENVRARVEGRPAGPLPREAKEPIESLLRQFAPTEPIREVTDEEVEQYAQVLHQRALQDRGSRGSMIEKFVRDNGGIAPYRRGESGKKEESEEYKAIPIHLRGKVPYDEMSAMLQDANLLPPDATYTELYDAVSRIPKRGDVPRLSEFRDQARHELENDPDIVINTPPPTDRKMLKRSFREAFGLQDDQAGAAADVADAWATQWAKDTGRPKEDWYKTRIAQVQQSYSLPGEEKEALFQGADMFPDAKQGVGETYERLVADAKAKGMTEKAARRFALDKMGTGREAAPPAAEAGKQMLLSGDPVQGFGSGARGERFLFQEGGPAAPFYSTLQKVLRDKMPERAPVDQVRNILNGQDVRREEVEWSGVEEFLKDKQTISRPELLNWLRDNEVRVEEVVKGGRKKLDTSGFTAKPSIQFKGVWVVKRPGEGPIEVQADSADQAIERAGEVIVGSETKFQGYQTPGGENYRELLLTLPRKGPIPISLVEYAKKVHGVDYLTQPPSEQSALLAAYEDNGRDILSESGGPRRFISPHFNEPNVLAHIRFNERTAPDGARTLFIEEVQSDWHQKGRSTGYKNPGLVQKNFVTWLKDNKIGLPEDEIERQFKARSGTQFDGWKADQDAAFSEAGKVPDAPFKKTWHELAMKRALRWAAENDFDRVAWTTGQQQADRYDLSKQLSEISYSGTNLKAFDKNGHEVISRTGVKPEELPDLIGKDAAQKLMDQTPKGTLRTISGVDLKVGGEGMKGFYDKILPDFVNKYTKKWGGRVAETKINSPEGTSYFDDDRNFPFAEIRPNGTERNRYTTREAAEAEMQAGNRIVEDKNPGKEQLKTIHSVDVTPAMKKAVLEGQPLFQRGGAPGPAKGATEFLEDFRAIIHGFTRADVSTAFHELSHVFRRDIYRRVGEAKASAKGELQGHITALENWAGVKDGVWTEPAEEKFARAFERYMADGKAPTPKLVTVFHKAKEWLMAIYNGITGSKIDVDVSPAVKAAFDRMLGGAKSKTTVRAPSRGAGEIGGPRVLLQEDEGPTPADDAEAQKLFSDAQRAKEIFAEPAKNATRHPPKEVLEALLDPKDKMKDLSLFEQFQVRESKEGEDPGMVTLPLFGQAGETSTLAPIRAMEVMDGKRFGIMKRNFLFPLQDADNAFQTELAAKKDAVDEVFKGMDKKDREMVFDVVENKEKLKEAWPPKNADRILEAAKYLQDEYDNLLNRLNLARAAVGKDPIKRRANYITHYQELGAIQDIAKMVGLNLVDVPASMLTISAMTKPNSPYFRFAKRRLGEKTERDALKAYQTYLEPALRTVHFAKAIKNGRDILEYKVRIPGEYEGATERGKVDERSLFGIRYPNAYNYLNNYLNRLAGKRDIVDRTFPVAAAITGVTNRLFSAGSIGGNISTVFTQPASIRNAAAETGLYALPGYMSFLNPKWRKFYEENSRIAKGRAYEPATRGERLMGSKVLAQLHDKAASALSIPVGAMDRVMTGGAYLAGYFKAKSLGFSREDAMRYADDVAERTQASANQVDRPPANAGKIKSALGQFQTFVYNEWSQLKNDMVKKSIEGENSPQGYDAEGLGSIREGRDVGLKRLGIYLAVTMAMSALYDELGIPNPFKQEGAKMPFLDTPATNKMWEHMVNQIPGISAARFGGSPVVKGITNGMLYLVGDERQREQAKKRLKGLAFRLIPGGGQISKTLSGQAVAANTSDVSKAARALVFGASHARDVADRDKPKKIKKKMNTKKRRRYRD